MATADSYGLFWNSDNGDRKYNADSMERWLRKFFTSGVFEGDMQVLASSGMTITVQQGYCNLFGKVGLFEVVNSITLDAANSRYPRIDTIVVERNDADRIIYLKKVNGSYSGENPQPTAPIWDETQGIYQLVLAQIYVGAGVSSISQEDITDKRTDTDVCGYIAGTVNEMDFSQFTAQFNQFFTEFKEGTLADVTQWYADRKSEFETWQKGQETDLSEWQQNRETNYETWYKDQQDAFLAWVQQMKDAMGSDPSSAIIALTQELDERLGLLEHMVIQNDVTCPITDDDGALLVFDDDSALLAEMSYDVA